MLGAVVSPPSASAANDFAMPIKDAALPKRGAQLASFGVTNARKIVLNAGNSCRAKMQMPIA
jgi:hypothetical protein